MPRVSIGMPVYNGQEFLEETMEGLLAQTLTDFELVLVDNASTDRTPELGRAYAARDPRVRYHRNAVNIGGGPNFNRAFELASNSPYFKWAAHDDLHAPEFLAECVAVLDARPEVVVCHSDSEFVDATGKAFAKDDPEMPNVGSERPSVRFRDLIISRHFCLDMFGVMRRAELAKTPKIASYVGSDRPMLAELGLLGRLHRVPRVLFQVRDHAGRSSKAIPDYLRGEWFDPKLQGSVALPHWRYLGEYNHAVWRVPMPHLERGACLVALAEWCVVNRRWLGNDVWLAARHRLAQKRASSST